MCIFRLSQKCENAAASNQIKCLTARSCILLLDLDADEVLQTIEILRVKFDIVVTGALYPQRFDSSRTFLVNGETVGEVNHFVFCSVNYENRGSDTCHLVDATHRT
jgi:hypothetical protein